MTKENIIKALRNLKSFRTRVLGVVSPTESRLTLLDDLGSLWDEFSLRYEEFDDSLDGMEAQAAKKIRDKFVTGKSFEDYYKEAETVYGEAETRLNKLLQDGVDKKRKQDKFRAERDLNISNTAIQGIIDLIGNDNLVNPDSFQVTGEPKIHEFKMMVRRLNKCLADQQENLDKAEEVEEVDADILARATQLVQNHKAQCDNFDLKLDSLLARADSKTTPVNNQATTPQPTPQVPSTLPPVIPSLNISVQSGTGSQYGVVGPPGLGSPDVSYGVNGSMVGPIHSTPMRHSFRTHEYTMDPSLSQVHNHSNRYTPHSAAMKMKNQEWPVFSGFWPDWPRFYSKWKNIVEAQGFSGKNLAEQLLQCVKGEAYKRIQAVIIVDDSSYITMWNRLLKLYTDPGTLLGWVYKQLEEFKPVRVGNHEEIVAFANDLEKIHSDLYQIDPSFPGRIIANKVDELAFLLPPSMLEK